MVKKKMKAGSGYSGSKGKQEMMRRQMSWAKQVDLTSPLDECEFRGQIEERQDVVDVVLVQKQLIAMFQMYGVFID